jgi:hypothetical protein
MGTSVSLAALVLLAIRASNLAVGEIGCILRLLPADGVDDRPSNVALAHAGAVGQARLKRSRRATPSRSGARRMRDERL